MGITAWVLVPLEWIDLSSTLLRPGGAVGVGALAGLHVTPLLQCSSICYAASAAGLPVSISHCSVLSAYYYFSFVVQQPAT